MENGISVRRTTGCGADGGAHQVVAVERDVERAGRNLVLVDLADRVRQAPGQRHAARADADERERLEPAIALEDLVRDARQRPLDPHRVHYDRHGDTIGIG